MRPREGVGTAYKADYFGRYQNIAKLNTGNSWKIYIKTKTRNTSLNCSQIVTLQKLEIK